MKPLAGWSTDANLTVTILQSTRNGKSSQSSLAAIILTVIALLVPVAASGADSAKPASLRKPNVVVLLADDLGYGDVQCNNPARSKIPTPCIDRLAAAGMRFTDAHSPSAVCSPTRYGLLTGRYAWRTRLRRGVLRAYDTPLIPAGRLTLPALLRQNGYTTACIGKWHLGWNWPFASDEVRKRCLADQRAGRPADFDFTQPVTGGPTTRGFDYYFGTHVPNQPPYCFIENDRVIGQPVAMLPVKETARYHTTTPGPALAGWDLTEILPALSRKAVQFIGDRAADQKPFFLYVPLTSPHEPVSPSKDWQGKSGINPVADFIMQTDGVVGEIVQALDKHGLRDNTLVIFTSDNGHAPYTGLPALLKNGHHPSGALRGYKSDIYEGGHRVPFIAAWPGHIKPDTTCDATVCMTDLLATCADIVGAKLPATAGEDSVSILPLLQGGRQPVRQHLVSQSVNGLLAIRRGPWKLIFGGGSGGWSQGNAGTQGQLFNLADDESETKNVYTQQPQLVAELTSLMERIISEGRSTPGPKQDNDVPVAIFGKEPSK